MKLSKRILLTLLTGAITVYFNNSKSFADIPPSETYSGESSLGATSPSPSGEICNPTAQEAVNSFSAMSQAEAEAAGYYS